MELDYDYFHNALDGVEHTTTVDAFYRQFHAIQSLFSFVHPEIPEFYFAGRFVYGLQAEYQNFIFPFKPVTVLAAYRLASIFEESIYLDYFPELEEELYVIEDAVSVHNGEETMVRDLVELNDEKVTVTEVSDGSNSREKNLTLEVQLLNSVSLCRESVTDYFVHQKYGYVEDNTQEVFVSAIEVVTRLNISDDYTHKGDKFFYWEPGPYLGHNVVKGELHLLDSKLAIVNRSLDNRGLTVQSSEDIVYLESRGMDIIHRNFVVNSIHLPVANKPMILALRTMKKMRPSLENSSAGLNLCSFHYLIDNAADAKIQYIIRGSGLIVCTYSPQFASQMYWHSQKEWHPGAIIFLPSVEENFVQSGHAYHITVGGFNMVAKCLLLKVQQQQHRKTKARMVILAVDIAQKAINTQTWKEVGLAFLRYLKLLHFIPYPLINIEERHWIDIDLQVSQEIVLCYVFSSPENKISKTVTGAVHILGAFTTLGIPIFIPIQFKKRVRRTILFLVARSLSRRGPTLNWIQSDLSVQYIIHCQIRTELICWCVVCVEVFITFRGVTLWQIAWDVSPTFQHFSSDSRTTSAALQCSNTVKIIIWDTQLKEGAVIYILPVLLLDFKSTTEIFWVGRPQENNVIYLCVCASSLEILTYTLTFFGDAAHRSIKEPIAYAYCVKKELDTNQHSKEVLAMTRCNKDDVASYHQLLSMHNLKITVGRFGIVHKNSLEPFMVILFRVQDDHSAPKICFEGMMSIMCFDPGIIYSSKVGSAAALHQKQRQVTVLILHAKLNSEGTWSVALSSCYEKYSHKSVHKVRQSPTVQYRVLQLQFEDHNREIESNTHTSLFMAFSLIEVASPNVHASVHYWACRQAGAHGVQKQFSSYPCINSFGQILLSTFVGIYSVGILAVASGLYFIFNLRGHDNNNHLKSCTDCAAPGVTFHGSTATKTVIWGAVHSSKVTGYAPGLILRAIKTVYIFAFMSVRYYEKSATGDTCFQNYIRGKGGTQNLPRARLGFPRRPHLWKHTGKHAFEAIMKILVWVLLERAQCPGHKKVSASDSSPTINVVSWGKELSAGYHYFINSNEAIYSQRFGLPVYQGLCMKKEQRCPYIGRRQSNLYGLASFPFARTSLWKYIGSYAPGIRCISFSSDSMLGYGYVMSNQEDWNSFSISGGTLREYIWRIAWPYFIQLRCLYRCGLTQIRKGSLCTSQAVIHIHSQGHAFLFTSTVLGTSTFLAGLPWGLTTSMQLCPRICLEDKAVL